MMMRVLITAVTGMTDSYLGEAALQVHTVSGAWPEAIPANCAGLRKLAPVIRELRGLDS